MIDDIGAARDAALAGIAAATTLDELAALGTELLGKRGPLAQLKARLGALPVEDRKEAGRLLNEALTAVSAALDASRAAAAAIERARRVEAERLDLTETMA
ncbi:MAG: phenylalanine--tRNA ligase subunit alpha, partial [Acidimicrobiia bacterium]|nr:phenylalanine--tRNA ligase subunit alpha [Acidimicrobiia bacterium]